MSFTHNKKCSVTFLFQLCLCVLQHDAKCISYHESDLKNSETCRSSVYTAYTWKSRRNLRLILKNSTQNSRKFCYTGFLTRFTSATLYIIFAALGSSGPRAVSPLPWLALALHSKGTDLLNDVNVFIHSFNNIELTEYLSRQTLFTEYFLYVRHSSRHLEYISEENRWNSCPCENYIIKYVRGDGGIGVYWAI